LQAFDVFKNFYLAKHSGRILTLQPGAGTADLNAVFYGGKRSEEEDKEEAGAAGGTAARGGHKKHILNVNTYQMVVLLMFNTRERLTYEEIKEVSSGFHLVPLRFTFDCNLMLIKTCFFLQETLIPDRELMRSLQPLAVGKQGQRILVKHPKTKVFFIPVLIRIAQY
jgi:cullin 3